MRIQVLPALALMALASFRRPQWRPGSSRRAILVRQIRRPGRRSRPPCCRNSKMPPPISHRMPPPITSSARTCAEMARDQTLSSENRLAYILRGLAAEDRALAAEPDFVEALIYKNLLLRLQAPFEMDAVARDALLREADYLRQRALQLGSTAAPAPPPVWRTAPPPPPPPPPPGGSYEDVKYVHAETSDAAKGGAIVPRKTKDAQPVHPPVVRAAGIHGVVVVEATVGVSGRITEARVVRSIPLLDHAALDAIRQWEFAPPDAGAHIPLVIEVTSRFAPPR